MPLGTPLMKNLEQLQVNFTRQINMTDSDISCEEYWDMLSFLRLYSVERRSERLKVLYTWKVLENLAPNYGITVNQTSTSGRLCGVPPLITGIPESVKNLRLRSLQHIGLSLWNSLPAELRAVTGVAPVTFKAKLDAYLLMLPDHPWTKYNTPEARHPLTGLPTNSIIYLARLHFGSTRRF
jgi:hypothetical protein